MAFHHYDYFLFLFVIVLGYRLLPWNVGKWWLILGSFGFYALTQWYYGILLLTSIVSSYSFALLIEKYQDIRHRRLLLFLGLSVNLSLLIFFKAAEEFVELINSFSTVLLTPPTPLISPLDIIFPIGISFYTFQAISHMVDVYRHKQHAKQPFANYALYISFFPQLIAGPIERGSKMLPQFIKKHKPTHHDYEIGITRILWGLVKKLVFADRIALFVDVVFAHPEAYPAPVLWLACFAFAQQIYLDFSAYADIAIGSARLFGIELSENFKSPYAAANILNFWQRFHITLSSCLRDYVFIPLGGTSRNNLRASLVLAFTMVLVGLWHGVEGHYILFGVYIAFWMVLYRIFRISCNKFRRIKTLRRLKSWHLFGVFLTFFVWMTGAPFFRGQNIESALTMYQTMFFKFDHLSIIFEGQYLYFLGLCLFTHSVHLYRNGQPKTGNYSPVFGGLRLALYCMVIIFFAVDTTSEFIYFQF